jgi:hypothetical protein
MQIDVVTEFKRKLKDDEIVSAIIADDSSPILTATEKGYGKRTNLDDTSDSLNLIDLPFAENSIMSFSPEVISTPTNLSPSLSSMAMMPPFLGREKFVNDVSLQVPLLVTIKAN